MYELGIVHMTAVQSGLLLTKDIAVSLKYFELAAEIGHLDAMCKAGQIHKSGEGVEKDMTKAVLFFRMAAVRGHARAIALLGILYMEGDGVEQSTAEATK